MTDPTIRIHLSAGTSVCQPAQTLSGTYEVCDVPPREVRAIECSVLWHTVGKGDEDLAVIHFQRDVYDVPATPTRSPRSPRHFHCELPAAPLSYEGVIVKVRWCVRVRVFLIRGQEFVEELPFRVGLVAMAEIIDAPAGEEQPAGSESQRLR